MNSRKFWSTIKTLTSVNAVLGHMDEKWCYFVFVQSTNKFPIFLEMQNKVRNPI